MKPNHDIPGLEWYVIYWPIVTATSLIVVVVVLIVIVIVILVVIVLIIVVIVLVIIVVILIVVVLITAIATTVTTVTATLVTITGEVESEHGQSDLLETCLAVLRGVNLTLNDDLFALIEILGDVFTSLATSSTVKEVCLLLFTKAIIDGNGKCREAAIPTGWSCFGVFRKVPHYLKVIHSYSPD
jgi:hypothetical protein